MSMPAMAALSLEVKDLALAPVGKKRIEWAFQSMPILQRVRKHLIATQPFASMRIAACLHVTPETANLMITLRDGGAGVSLCAAGLHSTHDDIAACLVKDYGIHVYARAGESTDVHQSHLDMAAMQEPHLLMDDGGSLITTVHERHPEFLAGANVVVAGFGPCGRSIAVRARGMGANVIITEVDPLRALEAIMEGYRVLSMHEAAVLGDLFITASGNKNVIAREHFEKFKNNVYLSNAGHSNVEIDFAALRSVAYSRRIAREHVEEFAMRDGRKIYLLSDARPVNMEAGEGQPAGVMDVAFAYHALVAEYLVRNRSSLPNIVHPVSPDMDRQVAKLKLEAMSVKIDRLTVEQEQYLASWSEAT